MIPDHTLELRRLTDSVSRSDDPTSSAALLSLLYDEIHRLAAARVAKLPPGQTLQATDLVHETYVRIASRAPDEWGGRRHFFFFAARSMRDILVESVRRKASKKRGGAFERITFSRLGIEDDRPLDDLLALDDALDALEHTQPVNYQVVMLRYFAGLDAAEIADVLQISQSTVKRKWSFARAWLLRAIDGPSP